MKLKVLVDNNTYIDEYYYGEPGVSYYIEDGKEKILLDVGYSDLYIRNAKKMGIDLNEVQKIVLSHSHNDHTGGLKDYFENYENRPEIIGCFGIFDEKYYKNLKISCPMQEAEILERTKVIYSNTPKKITKNIIFLGEIPRSNDFENKSSLGKLKKMDEYVDDYNLDDSALVYKTDKGIYIITGCSHSGICNIIEYAKNICKNNRVLGVVGGFHLFDIDYQTEETIKYLKKNNINKNLYPCHCVSLKVKTEMSKYLEINEVGVGLELNW
ncbi:MBL fold metallo-hydrolase [Fusobacterium sp. MFO224]|uniref:MBL fold metallo-hydrolase n=1 Tax=Fusobacterium sp. MFO224 TaxID=3378070 RepID=UPI003854C0AE